MKPSGKTNRDSVPPGPVNVPHAAAHLLSVTCWMGAGQIAIIRLEAAIERKTDMQIDDNNRVTIIGEGPSIRSSTSPSSGLPAGGLGERIRRRGSRGRTPCHQPENRAKVIKAGLGTEVRDLS